MKRCVRHIVLWLLLVAWLGAAADGTGRLKNYDIWKDLPSKTLIQMSRGFYEGDKPDSALLCLSIVANRYYTSSNNNSDELQREAAAMNVLGILYTYYFVDYNKAHQVLLQAQKIAKATGNQELLAAEKAEFLFQIDEINAEVQELTARQRLTRTTHADFADRADILIC